MGPSLLRAREPQQLGCWGVRALGGLGLPAAVRGLGRACSRCGLGSFPWPPASLARPSLRRPGPLGWVVLGLRAVAVPLVRLAAFACGPVRSWGAPPGVAARVPVLALACGLVRLALWLCWSGWVGLGCARAPFGLSLGGAAPFCGAPSHPVPLGWRSCLRCLFHLLVPFCFTSVGRLVSRFSQFGASVDDRASSWTS